MHKFIGDITKIDGKTICYQLTSATDYLIAKGIGRADIPKYISENQEIMILLNQIMGLKISIFLLRRTSEIQNSLSEDLCYLKLRLIDELKNQNFIFDESFVDNYVVSKVTQT